jgi:hypothetical protein
MATVQVNGSALTSTPYGSFSQANNDNGTMKANGSSSSNVMDQVKTVVGPVDAFGSKVVENSVTVVDYAGKSVSAGTFAYNNTKPISSLVTTTIAGVANSSILTPGNDGDTVRSINKVETVRSRRFTSAVRANKYNRVTNKFDAGFPVVAEDTLASDDAATPSRSVPGELTYMRGSTTPYNDDYKAKTN